MAFLFGNMMINRDKPWDFWFFSHRFSDKCSHFDETGLSPLSDVWDGPETLCSWTFVQNCQRVKPWMADPWLAKTSPWLRKWLYQWKASTSTLGGHKWVHQRKLGSNTSVLRTNRILRLEMMKGGARLRLDLDEGWCETLHYITIHHKRIDLDEGWCETLHYITIHQKRIDLDEGWYIT